MKLAELSSATSFALLGPGFGQSEFVLLRDLVPATSADPMLVFCPFEDTGSQALRFAAESVSLCEVEFEPEIGAIEINLFADNHAQKVNQIREAIACGDVYQVCLTMRADLSEKSGAKLLSAMCKRNVPRFAAWVRLPDGREFVSGSPELFFETEGRIVHAEPMKGTAQFGAGVWLEDSAKDRCELAMITDLVRNDLAQVSRPRTTRVANERRVLELAYAVQTVSDIVSILDERATPLDVLEALHPGGSVTGAPKPAALAMIRQLENTPRGAYCGALGLWSGERSVFSLLIRTASKGETGWVYGVGGGIVYDSDPQAELDELYLKIGALR
jgi:anthranilate/para-aminobenzoate synthase component I